MPKNTKKSRTGLTVGVIFAGLIGLSLVIRHFLQGHNVALLNPKGMIAHEELKLMLITVGILLLIAIPTMVMFYFTAWKYRETNKKAVHNPAPRHGALLNAAIWLVPGAFAVGLALFMWPATHQLAPQKSIEAEAEPLTIQVVSLRWKWLFIYPDQRVASVNFVQIPEDTPVRFQLTADDAPMSSFWVPNLSGMLYTMTGHTNTLNLIAETPGDYPGRSGEINGAGFAGMQFTARVGSTDDFYKWVENTRNDGTPLDEAAYKELLRPSESNPPAFYSTVNSNLYDKILMKYKGAGGGHDHSGQGAHTE